MTFYADGVQYSHDNDNKYGYSSPINILNSTQVVAFRCEDNGGVCGLKVNLSNGVKTDTTWKCSDRKEVGWQNVSFDDSAWENAKFRHDKRNLIWATGKNCGKGKIVYCRKSIIGLPSTSIASVSTVTTTVIETSIATTTVVFGTRIATTPVGEPSAVTTTVVGPCSPTITVVEPCSPITTAVIETSTATTTVVEPCSLTTGFGVQPSSTGVAFLGSDGVLRSQVCRDVVVVTSAMIEDAISTIYKELKIDKSKMSSVIRKKVSQKDERTSSATIGYFGLIFFILPLALIIISDAPKLIEHLATLRHPRQ
ncbi:uncharacterized protein LOC126815488 [Patella vulgata]|uniref:uncharacterized protein LOC126815488 n=1 Tax=Patella vulgata TaxID=6465 RepID=UPI00217F8145|nr:uncharacterized protein LOC126815488 [Patella vulgata]